MQILKLELLSQGKNVVIDAMAPANIRAQLFDTCVKQSFSIIAHRMLIEIRASEEILQQRNTKRGRVIAQQFEMEDSGQSCIYQRRSFRNDNLEQQAQNFKKLNALFG